jgi:hypothetical protein
MGQVKQTVKSPKLLFGKANTKMVRIGIASIGFMRMIHYLAARKVPSAAATTLCSRDRKKLDGDRCRIHGNGRHGFLSGSVVFFLISA